MVKHFAVAKSVAVIGLGRFGASLALELTSSGSEVLGVDIDAAAASALSGQLTHVVQADAAQEEAFTDLRLADFDRVVVAIGANIVASCLVSSISLSHGLDVWAKAISGPHARILQKLGVQHVVQPEHDMGRRVAHLVRGGMLDYIEFDADYAMATILTPPALADKSLGTSGIRARHGVTVVAASDSSGEFTYATGDTKPQTGDRLIVAGTITRVERFSALAQRQIWEHQESAR